MGTVGELEVCCACAVNGQPEGGRWIGEDWCPCSSCRGHALVEPGQNRAWRAKHQRYLDVGGSPRKSQPA